MAKNYSRKASVLSAILVSVGILSFPAAAAPLTLTDMFVACEEDYYLRFKAIFEREHLTLKDLDAMGKLSEAGIAGGICHRFNSGNTVHVDEVKGDLSCVRLEGAKTCFWAVTRTVR
ncbi:hypothetical protein [Bradyrhizobium sp. AZCC 1610]|uniref:hypothetical protein n=1 Tax=Bradyrhizobium sp. AZCC 1610 TaxID=3117020 RepID=UPI002FEF089A